MFQGSITGLSSGESIPNGIRWRTDTRLTYHDASHTRCNAIKCGWTTPQLPQELVSSQTTSTITYNEIRYPLLYPRCGGLPPFRGCFSSVSSGSAQLWLSYIAPALWWHLLPCHHRRRARACFDHLQEGATPSKPYECPRRFLPFRGVVCFPGAH